ncbi:hypothetical protein DPEC_G00373850 [Dallia pectoralis]|nr:hypothetical protein DPEC_G00373850 [Dallia pectoralis]
MDGHINMCWVLHLCLCETLPAFFSSSSLWAFSVRPPHLSLHLHPLPPVRSLPSCLLQPPKRSCLSVNTAACFSCAVPCCLCTVRNSCNIAAEMCSIVVI